MSPVRAMSRSLLRRRLGSSWPPPIGSNRSAAAIPEAEAAWTPPFRPARRRVGQRDRADAGGCTGIGAVRSLRIFSVGIRGLPGRAADIGALHRGRRVLHGPDRDAIFRQDHPPGRMGLSTSPTWAGSVSRLWGSRSITGSTISGWRSRALSMPMWGSGARVLWRSRKVCRMRRGRWAAYRNNTAATSCRRRLQPRSCRPGGLHTAVR